MEVKDSTSKLLKNAARAFFATIFVAVWALVLLPEVIASLEVEAKVLAISESAPESYPESFASGEMLSGDKNSTPEVKKNYSPGLIYVAPTPTKQPISPVFPTSKSPIMATCKNCIYFPVNKNYALPASYSPTVIETGLPGGGRLTPDTVAALKLMFADMEAAGHKPKVNSAYRSYSDQLSTFNYWYQREIKAGKSPAAAEIAANKYSAKAGHSEHQLGTTLDINSQNSSAFDTQNTANNKLWAFVAANAHKYGFIISYPSGSEPFTGYVYEPWHIRYIGVEFATALYNKGYLTKKGYYNADMLIEKALWKSM